MVIGPQDWDAFARRWLESWVSDAGINFESDFPAFDTWAFGRNGASRIAQTVLNLVGANSPEAFRRAREVIGQWIPQARNTIIVDSSHYILQANPCSAAEHIVQHVNRHPIGA